MWIFNHTLRGYGYDVEPLFQFLEHMKEPYLSTGHVSIDAIAVIA